MKEKSKNRHKNLSKGEKVRLKNSKEKDSRNLFSAKRKYYKIN